MSSKFYKILNGFSDFLLLLYILKKIETIWEVELNQSKALFEKENPNIYKEDLIDIQWARVDLDVLYFKGDDVIRFEYIQSICEQLIAFTKSVKSMSAVVIPYFFF